MKRNDKSWRSSQVKQKSSRRPASFVLGVLPLYLGGCTLLVSAPKNELPGKLTPSLQAVKPPGSKIIREIQEFHDIDTNMFPQSELVHNLYIQPQLLNFSNFAGSSSARNLLLEIKVLESDADPKAEVCLYSNPKWFRELSYQWLYAGLKGYLWEILGT